MKKENKKQNSSKSEVVNVEKRKPAYSTPEIKSFGTIFENTQTFSKGTKTDGGAFPNNKKMCVTPSPIIEEHRLLLSDTFCQESYYKAIMETVKPGDVVLDLGTGTGIHALFACQAGARKVYAIESGSMIEGARKASEANGFSDRIEFIFADSKEVELPEKVDVILSNTGFLGSIENIPDACARFLKPNGRVLPDRIQMSFALVDAGSYYREAVEIWGQSKFGLDFSAFRFMATNHPLYHHFEGDELQSQESHLPEIDLTKNPVDRRVWNFELKADRSGKVNGLVGWYAFKSQGREIISTRPPLKLHPGVWSHIFLPFETEIVVEPGHRFDVSICLDTTHGHEMPQWSWRVLKGEQMVANQSTEVGLNLPV